jgi:NAD(P)-dependent dehydrogenase (short-subunit alcohol dehydrogenase family)
VREAVATLERDPGRLDVLINNAAAYVDWTETAASADLADDGPSGELRRDGRPLPW